MTTWQRLQQGWPASFPLAQFPNPPLIAAFVAWIIAALTRGDVHDHARAVFYVGLSVWAWLEVSDGANWVRRAFGIIGMVYVVVEIASALGG
jgi:hypothetical protein